MLYCEKCMFLCSGDECLKCGTKKLREPKENDPVYLTTKEALWSGGIEDILKENGIPCLKKGMQGPAITERLGYVTETYQFFVPFGGYETSKNLLNQIYDTEF